MTAALNAHQAKAQPELVALFVSDTHLNPSLPKTTTAFLRFLELHASHAPALYLLGDLFEYWVGDDNISDAYNQIIVTALRTIHDGGVELYWIGGNRDFLIGEGFAKATGAALLPDPFVIQLKTKNIVITHGDAQCTDDRAYMEFRQKVRQVEWQKAFLAMPLLQRKNIIEGLRTESKSEQKQKTAEIMDVNSAAIEQLFLATDSSVLIHGHTHRPATHIVNDRIRHVLPDWDCDTNPERGGWSALYSDSTIRSYNWNGDEL
ncbi:UDP-2,3-diacylglucosamine diphosphatase [Undibacterium sp. TJN19]|uniref:UDP-2,3-diacylglucosamine diphosphatase n=1 Tax=Undibacterium sp. TJN19 TaxID=3413055 RepID=UPI003BF1854D